MPKVLPLCKQVFLIEDYDIRIRYWVGSDVEKVNADLAVRSPFSLPIIPAWLTIQQIMHRGCFYCFYVVNAW